MRWIYTGRTSWRRGLVVRVRIAGHHAIVRRLHVLHHAVHHSVRHVVDCWVAGHGPAGSMLAHVVQHPPKAVFTQHVAHVLYEWAGVHVTHRVHHAHEAVAAVA